MNFVAACLPWVNAFLAWCPNSVFNVQAFSIIVKSSWTLVKSCNVDANLILNASQTIMRFTRKMWAEAALIKLIMLIYKSLNNHKWWKLLVHRSSYVTLQPHRAGYFARLISTNAFLKTPKNRYEEIFVHIWKLHDIIP